MRQLDSELRRELREWLGAATLDPHFECVIASAISEYIERRTLPTAAQRNERLIEVSKAVDRLRSLISRTPAPLQGPMVDILGHLECELAEASEHLKNHLQWEKHRRALQQQYLEPQRIDAERRTSLRIEVFMALRGIGVPFSGVGSGPARKVMSSVLAVADRLDGRSTAKLRDDFSAPQWRAWVAEWDLFMGSLADDARDARAQAEAESEAARGGPNDKESN